LLAPTPPLPLWAALRSSRRAASSTGAPKNIIYGTTELVTASEFLRQLNALGTKQYGF